MTVVNPASGSLLDGGYCCGAMGGWGWLGMVAVSLVMLGLIVLATRAVQRPPSHSTPKPTPLEILAARYASGEISEQEYDESRLVLREDANE